MSDQSGAKDPGAIWRGQPEERVAVHLERIVNRRAKELYSSTRSEILLSIGAALIVGVMAWQLAPAHDRLLEICFAAVITWVVISSYRFRHWIWRRVPVRPDGVAATGLEYYRQELQRRRDHLRNAWLWHGPLFLACMILLAILIRKSLSSYGRLRNVLPFSILLVVWTGLDLTRRRRQGKELQREIDEIEPSGEDSDSNGGEARPRSGAGNDQ